MPATNELRKFHQFVGEKLAEGRMSPEEALLEWRVEHPSPDDLAENVAALRLALDEADRGEALLLDEVIAKLRQKYRLPAVSTDR
ncbi:MAG: hypothetical protein ACT4QC_12410 [Planctomycetaceae bacterium]